MASLRSKLAGEGGLQVSSDSEGLAASGAEAEGWVLLQGTGVCRPGALQGSRVTRARRGARGCACLGKGAERPAPGVSSVRKEGVRDRVEVINQAHGGQTRARKKHLGLTAQADLQGQLSLCGSAPTQTR